MGHICRGGFVPFPYKDGIGIFMKHYSEYAFETVIATLLDNGRRLQKEASGGDRQDRPKGEPQNEPI